VTFLERAGAAHITTALALRWAMAPQGVQRATWARRLSMVRRFAMWLSAVDPQTEVQPPRALTAGRRRHRPHIFSDAEIGRLMA
jgi:integrase/recombinase XerD